MWGRERPSWHTVEASLLRYPINIPFLLSPTDLSDLKASWKCTARLNFESRLATFTCVSSLKKERGKAGGMLRAKIQAAPAYLVREDG